MIDEGQQELEVSLSYFTSNSLPTVAPVSDSFQVLVRFIDASGSYMEMEPGTGVTDTNLNAGTRSESLLYYSFDALTMPLLRVPAGARSVVLQIVLPVSQTVFCFDYFAMRLGKWDTLHGGKRLKKKKWNMRRWLLGVKDDHGDKKRKLTLIAYP